jgi:hypothetical protein
LRALTEAECYTRCYGERVEGVTVLRDADGSTLPAARFEKSLRQMVEERLAALEDEAA